MKTIQLSVLLILSAITCFAQTESALQTARKHYQDDNYTEAIKALTRAAEEEPQNAQVPYLTGRAYLDMNNYKKAAAFLEKAIAMDSSRNNWMYELGLIYYAIPDYNKSLQYILLAGEKGYKKSNDYLENLGNAYVNVKQYEKAVELFKEVLKKKPEDPELIYQVAQAYYRMGKYQEAIDYWDQVFGMDKTNAEVLYMIGLSYQKKGEKQKGQGLCDRAIEMDPSLRSKRQRMGGDF